MSVAWHSPPAGLISAVQASLPGHSLVVSFSLAVSRKPSLAVSRKDDSPLRLLECRPVLCPESRGGSFPHIGMHAAGCETCSVQLRKEMGKTRRTCKACTTRGRRLSSMRCINAWMVRRRAAGTRVCNSWGWELSCEYQLQNLGEGSCGQVPSLSLAHAVVAAAATTAGQRAGSVRHALMCVIIEFSLNARATKSTAGDRLRDE